MTAVPLEQHEEDKKGASHSGFWSERDQALERFVTVKVLGLQRGYLANESSAVRSLALYRRGAGADWDRDLGLWLEVLDGLPPTLMGGDASPSTYERAAAVSIGLYAVHQQSQRDGVHVRGATLGRAVRQLARHLDDESHALQRLHALGTASGFDGCVHHLRGLVRQLRSSQIPLDYGRLAVDLRRIQNADAAPGVRLDWARHFHRTRPEPDSTEPTSSENPQIGDN